MYPKTRLPELGFFLVITRFILMALQARGDLEKIGREAFDLLDQFQRRRGGRPPQQARGAPVHLLYYVQAPPPNPPRKDKGA